MTSAERGVHSSFGYASSKFMSGERAGFKSFKDISLLHIQFKDSLKSASELKIFRKVCDTEEKDGRNHIYFEFLQRNTK